MAPDESRSTAGQHRSTTRRRALAGLAAGAFAASAGCITISRERSTETVTDSVAAEPLDRLDIVNSDGDIVLERTSGDAVEVTAKKSTKGSLSLENLGIDTVVDGDRLRVETNIDTSGLLGSGWIDLRIAVPSDVAVESVDTTDGDISMDGIPGDPRVSTVNGDLHVRQLAGDLRAELEDGDVTVRGTDGVVAASTVDGDVTIEDPGGLDSVVVTAGDVTTDVPHLRSDAHLETTDGDIVVRLTKVPDLRIEARTTAGDITGRSLLEDVETATERELEGQVGEGSYTLVLESTAGDIEIRQS